MSAESTYCPDDIGQSTDMSKKDSNSSEESDYGCIFCLIASERDPDAEVLKKNDELVCFQDIYPAAPHHYLVVPREHIVNCESLHKEHIGLVKRMADLGIEVLRERGVTDMTDIRLGFHKPPFTSVDHLHLHVLAPGSQISIAALHKFIPGSVRFVTESCLRKDLKNELKSQSSFLTCLPCKRMPPALKWEIEAKAESSTE